ncbi:MAG: IS30 family transposase [Steroidobacteraceae bacterium]
MTQGARRAQIWARRAAGEPIYRIAAALGCRSMRVQEELDRTGGIAPPVRRRAHRALSLAEREGISRGLRAGLSPAAIARELGRPRCTLSREIARNGGPRAYRAHLAEAHAWARARRPKACKLALNLTLCAYVRERLIQDQWSPEQIAHTLARRYGSDHSARVSHETIYRTLFVQSRGALKRELCAHLRTQRVRRGARKAQAPGARSGSIVGELSIRERPAEASDRAVPGHWEGDLLCGQLGTQIATLVERHSRFVMLVKMPDKNSVHVAQALARHIRRLPAQLKRSLTWDRGIEMASHARFTLATDVRVYFCDPQSPWQRGSNENTNGLLRQYFHKRADLSVYSQAYLDQIADRLNRRPRETLGWITPAEKLAQSVASTG